jgi:acetyl esterase
LADIMDPPAYAFDDDLVEIATALAAHPSDISDLEAARQMSAAILADHAAPDTAGMVVDRRRVPGRGTAADVAIIVVRPEPDGTDRRTGGLLCIHGGGFAIGRAEDDLFLALWIVQALGIVVTLVDYRLAPEHPYPAGLDDCYAALTWMHGAADQLGLDPDRIGVYGSSCGATLAAGTALLARDLGGPPLCLQYLALPVLDDRLDTPSMRDLVDTPVWHRRNAELSWAYYLGEPRHDVPAYASPARAEVLAGLPCTYISTAEFDPLRDEGCIYAMRLSQAGVAVELHQFAGTYHGSILVSSAWSTHRQLDEMIDVLRRRLGPAHPG